MRSESGNGAGRSSTASTTGKMAVFDPIPMAAAALVVKQRTEY